MNSFLKTASQITLDTFHGAKNHGVRRMSAGLAYYLLFSLTPLIWLVVMAGSVLIGTPQSLNIVMSIIVDVLGPQVGGIINQTILQGFDDRLGIFAAIFAVLFLIWGASRMIVHIEQAFGFILGTSNDKGEGFIRDTIQGRIRSVLYLIFITVLILVAFLLNLILPIILGILDHYFFFAPQSFLIFVQIIGSFLVMLFIFATIYKVIAPGILSWSASFIGSAVASFLFIIINTLFSIYVSYSYDLSFYGTIGSFFALLIWVYWVAQSLLYGAEAARSYSNRKYAQITLKDVLE